MTAPHGAHARHREQQIRRILAEQAEQVVPGDGMAEIRARIAAPRPWWWRWWDAARALDRYLTTGFASIALTPHSKTAAPGGTPGRPIEQADYLRGHPAMTTIIQRHARELHAGDVIVHDPDHNRPVRWRVSRPPVRTRDGEYALTNVVDQATGVEHVTYYPVLQSLDVEPVGGAQ